MSNWTHLTPLHFRRTVDTDEARSLFKNSVRQVEIELFSYCNRTCWFCPNNDGSRLGKNIHMDSDLYESIINDLKSIQYDKLVTYSRYNEPLYGKTILSKIRQARIALPNAIFHTNTNGDYINASYLEELRDCGLNSLNIQIYLKNFERYSHDKIREKGEFIINKLGLPCRLVKDVEGIWLEWEIHFEGLAIRLYGRNFEENGTSRGDTVDIALDFRRTAPCLMPAWAVYVDFNGAMMPCCNLRSDIPSHAEAIVAQLKPGDSLIDAFGNSELVEWRRALFNFEEKSGLCRSCRFSQERDTPENRAAIERLMPS